MKLTVFQSGKGDCLLLTGKRDKGRILVDGGMGDAYSSSRLSTWESWLRRSWLWTGLRVAHRRGPYRRRAATDGRPRRNGGCTISSSSRGYRSSSADAPRPPQVKELWHNSFHEMLTDNKGKIIDLTAASASGTTLDNASAVAQISDLLNASAKSLLGTSSSALLEAAAEQLDIATSIPQAIQLSRRVSTEQLGIL